VFKWKSILDGRISRARINGAHRIPEPPRLSTFKRRGGGGGPESGVHLFNGRDQSARINGAQGDSGPPPPPPLAFLPLSGGGGGVRNQARIFPTAEIKAPGSTALRRSHPSQLLCFKSTWALLPGCHVSPHLHSFSPSHHPLTTCHVFRSLPR
jgi:hypothetical protein